MQRSLVGSEMCIRDSNPTGQLWGKNSLETIIKKYKLVICDEAFLSLTPNGDRESLIPLTKKYDNLLVLRSLTKIFNIPGLRLGYVIGSSKKLKQWEIKRDPWPLNSFAIKAGIDLLSNKKFYEQWTKQIHSWINVEKKSCLLYTSPSPRDYAASRMPSSA